MKRGSRRGDTKARWPRSSMQTSLVFQKHASVMKNIYLRTSHGPPAHHPASSKMFWACVLSTLKLASSWLFVLSPLFDRSIMLIRSDMLRFFFYFSQAVQMQHMFHFHYSTDRTIFSKCIRLTTKNAFFFQSERFSSWCRSFNADEAPERAKRFSTIPEFPVFVWCSETSFNSQVLPECALHTSRYSQPINEKVSGRSHNAGDPNSQSSFCMKLSVHVKAVYWSRWSIIM